MFKIFPPEPQPAPTSDEMAASPTMDHAHAILTADLTLTNDQRADAWDAFHAANTPEQLVKRLSALDIPDSTKQKLFEAKSVTAPVPTPADNVRVALNQMATIPRNALEAAEKHPRVFKAFVDAATEDK